LKIIKKKKKKKSKTKIKKKKKKGIVLRLKGILCAFFGGLTA
jgi:hypothetical protein